MEGERLSRDELRKKAIGEFGVDVEALARTEAGLESARQTMESGAGAVAVAASGMDEESLQRIRTAFEEPLPPEAA